MTLGTWTTKMVLNECTKDAPKKNKSVEGCQSKFVYQVQTGALSVIASSTGLSLSTPIWSPACLNCWFSLSASQMTGTGVLLKKHQCLWGVVPSLIVTCYTMYTWYSWEACSFLKRNWRRVHLGKSEGRGGELGRRRENCSWM